MAYTDNTPMPFGKHKGTKLANVPADYLFWLDGQYKEKLPEFWSGKRLAKYIADNREGIEAEATELNEQRNGKR